MEPKGLIKINLDGKPFEKLIQVVSEGIGTLYRPRRIRQEADAQAYAIKVLRKASAEAEAEAAKIQSDTASLIIQRLEGKEIRRQENIDTVVELASQNLEGKSVSDKQVDVDWATRFFNIVQDVSKEEMKVLWAKILAKEIERPSSFSLRTLELLRTVSSEEAELFVRLSEFILKQESCFVFIEKGDMSKYGLSYNDLASLRESGFLQTGELVQRTYYSKNTEIQQSIIVYGHKVIVLTIPPNTKNIVIPIGILTRAGCEIYELIEHEDNMDYMKDFATFIKKNNPSATVQYGSLLEIKGNQVRYSIPLTFL